jgi:hypothetical protein
MVSIRCDEQQIQLATSYQLTDFPLKYLEIPLSVCKLDKVTLQPLVDRMEYMLPVLKGRLMHHNCRLVLIKTTLATIPVHMSIRIGLLPWLIKDMNKIMTSFLLTGTKVV